MSVIHILKNGKRLTDISGHVVKVADAEQLYQLIHSLQKQERFKR